MAKTMRRSVRDLSSAEIIREMRGPLPEDDPNLELVNGEYVLREKAHLSPAQKEAVQELIRDLKALPEGTVLTMDEVAAFARRMPGRPSGWTSALSFRELRGPLPDPDFPE